MPSNLCKWQVLRYQLKFMTEQKSFLADKAKKIVYTYSWRPGFKELRSTSRSYSVLTKSRAPSSPNAPHSVLIKTFPEPLSASSKYSAFFCFST